MENRKKYVKAIYILTTLTLWKTHIILVWAGIVDSLWLCAMGSKHPGSNPDMSLGSTVP